jgi:glycerol-3-phosphate dehydrogenase
VSTGEASPTASLNAARRARELAMIAERGEADLLVVGGGVTGAGVALDAAARGLSVVLAERSDLAFGTSRWSSKLVHGGLRYLARGEVAIAYESAAERGLIMGRIAPHLTRPLPMIYPWLPETSLGSKALAGAGLAAADVLRRAARTSRQTLPAPRRLTRAEALTAVPCLRRDVGGGMLTWDGQLTDDARLVVAIARTAAAHGAVILTRCEASGLTADGAVLTDTLTGGSFRLRAGAVVNAAGVWAGQLAEGVRLQPSRGTHLVLADAAFGGLRAGVIAPVPGERARFVFAVPVPGEPRVYAGLTDEPAAGPLPEVPEPTPGEITFLLDTVSGMLDVPLSRSDVLGAFAGLRPLLAGGSGEAGGATADLSRKHAVLTSPDGVITVVGGKLTTYRRMAQDAVDAALAARAARAGRAGRAGAAPGRSGRSAGPCRTRRLPLIGAADRRALARVRAPARLVARYGTEAPAVLALAGPDPRLAEPVTSRTQVTGAEFAFAVRHEGALDAADLLDRRTRIGLVPGDRDEALAAALRALAQG